jgi:hypothetical protein
MKEIDLEGDLGLCGRMILIWFLKELDEKVWIRLNLIRIKFKAAVNTAMDLVMYNTRGNFYPAELLSPFP